MPKPREWETLAGALRETLAAEGVTATGKESTATRQDSVAPVVGIASLQRTSCSPLELCAAVHLTPLALMCLYHWLLGRSDYSQRAVAIVYFLK